MRMTIYILLGIVAVTIVAVALFLNSPAFGRLPRGERQARIERSPNFRDGEFRNLERTPQLTSDRSRLAVMLGFLFRKQKDLRPEQPMPAVKTDLHALDPQAELLVWFGHSSYFLQSGGRRFLVDPVFCKAAPVGWLNKPFAGTDIYKPEDIPAVDYLLITHDHWDHLDYRTVTALRDRIGKVICPLGVGEHFERWGFDSENIVELDWQETYTAEDGITLYCLSTRHFSGRGPKPNRTLWASYLLETPVRKIYLSGDGGYGAHFAEIGKRFPDIDLAILENGQYNRDWRYIHLMPELLPQAVADLNPRRVMTVHHSKYALARHRWDEPLENELKLRADSVCVLIPQIGQPVMLD